MLSEWENHEMEVEYPASSFIVGCVMSQKQWINTLVRIDKVYCIDEGDHGSASQIDRQFINNDPIFQTVRGTRVNN